MFVLFGEVFECMGHHFLEWYGERKIKYWHGEREKCFAKMDRASKLLSRWQFLGAITSELFRALFTTSLMKSRLNQQVTVFDVINLAASANVVTQVIGRKFTMEPTLIYQMKISRLTM